MPCCGLPRLAADAMMRPSMTDDAAPPSPQISPLHALADAAGIAREWRDVVGRTKVPTDAVLEAVLAALGHACASETQIAASLAALEEQARTLPPMLVGDAEQEVILPVPRSRAEATSAEGVSHALVLTESGFIAPPHPGYYTLELDGSMLQLAVAPQHCPLPPAAPRPWGTAVQIPALRGLAASDFGDFGDLARAAEALAARGAAALAINPVHALFPGHGHQFSPYSPSSRTWLNAALADPALVGLPPLPASTGTAEALIDWDHALPRKLAALRDVYARLDAATAARFQQAVHGNEALRRHAVFDAIDTTQRPAGAHGWRDWPPELQDPASPAVAAFAAQNADEVDFHLFCQWLAREGLDEVQRRALAAGMGIGLVDDLAVGVDPSGSDAWAMPHAMLRGLTIGAPPDPLGPLGQNWALTSYSPQGLRDTGYAPFIAMLRSAFEGAGGLRIDHAFGLSRLWVIPEGGSSGDGAYLSYPFADMIRLVTLEAHLAGALVIAEDLGTSPHGFTQAITERRMLGMQVLWFQRAEDHGFIGAGDYHPLAVAMTGTHDTPTVAGWWSGRDIDWAGQLGRLPDDIPREHAQAIRDWDRGLLWSTFGKGGERPATHDAWPAVDAALDHIAATPCALAIVPLEDLLAEQEQPNLPGTIDEHPNWRRRLAAPLEQLLEQPEVAARMGRLRS
jgi:4-alpha-glucanotransferase